MPLILLVLKSRSNAVSVRQRQCRRKPSYRRAIWLRRAPTGRALPGFPVSTTTGIQWIQVFDGRPNNFRGTKVEPSKATRGHQPRAPSTFQHHVTSVKEARQIPLLKEPMANTGVKVNNFPTIRSHCNVQGASLLCWSSLLGEGCFRKTNCLFKKGHVPKDQIPSGVVQEALATLKLVVVEMMKHQSW